MDEFGEVDSVVNTAAEGEAVGVPVDEVHCSFCPFVTFAAVSE